MPCTLVGPPPAPTLSYIPAPGTTPTTTGAPQLNSQGDQPPAIVGNAPIKAPAECKDFPADGYDTLSMYAMKISNNFTLGDLSLGGAGGPRKIINGSINGYKLTTMMYPNPGGQPAAFTPNKLACNLATLARTVLDPTDEYMKSLGLTMRITSGFRSGSNQSDHGAGLAADFDAAGNFKESTRVSIMKWMLSALGSNIRQIIFEKSTAGSPNGWIHVAVATPNSPVLAGRQILTWVGGNYMNGLPGQAGVSYTVLT